MTNVTIQETFKEVCGDDSSAAGGHVESPMSCLIWTS